MKQAIVTGATGFVGNKVVDELCKRNYNVIAVVRENSQRIDTLKNKNVEIIQCSLDKIKNLSTLLEGREVNTVYHFAWEGTAGPLRGDYNTQINNIEYSLDLMKVAKELGCNRFVFASSIMEYEVQAIMETNTNASINHLYSIAKHSANYMLRTYANANGINYIRGVISNIYGPGETSPRLVNTSLRKMIKGEHCSFSPGEQMYDFVYIDDAANMFIEIGEKGNNNTTYYIGSLNPRTLKEWLLEMRDVVDPSIEIGLGDFPFNGISLNYNEFDIEAIKKDTGYIQQTSWKTGIKYTLDWLKDN